MKLTFCLLCTLALPHTPVQAASNAFTLIGSEQTVEHGGGCRKSSPAGQCCHAGSKPLHCH